ncbi:hypothetical protein INR49_000017 [Caranx melampygus]|nr:hypothetical protein INR49_000017 [Caranx melampygus]
MHYNKLAKRSASAMAEPEQRGKDPEREERDREETERGVHGPCAEMSDVSEESLLDYFYSSGGNSGRVRNADILKTFKPFIGHSDLQLRAKYREEFKLIIDRIAVVKSENGEKFLVLKKKYRQLLQERDAKHQGVAHDNDGGQKHTSPSRTTVAAQWDVTDASTTTTSSSSPTPPQLKEQQDEPMSCGEPDGAAETAAVTVQQHKPPQPPVVHIQSESEQDEECSGSMGSAAVALDPIEKEWIYSAAGARVPDLSQLLRQDPSLANKKETVTTSGSVVIITATECDVAGNTDTALHWAAKHGNQDMATLVVNAAREYPGCYQVVIGLYSVCIDLNNMAAATSASSSSFSDVMFPKRSGYTPLHIAALHGHQHILDLLVGTYGAKENLRDYSGHLACHYLNIKEPEGPEEECELQFQVTQARERNRNRKLVSLFQSKKKWGSAEELAPIEEERTASHQLALPPFRPRKFSR